MKEHNFLWAVKQTLKGKRATRKNGFSDVEMKYILNIKGNILGCKLKNYVFEVDKIKLKVNDYLAKDYILWEK